MAIEIFVIFFFSFLPFLHVLFFYALFDQKWMTTKQKEKIFSVINNIDAISSSFILYRTCRYVAFIFTWIHRIADASYVFNHFLRLCLPLEYFKLYAMLFVVVFKTNFIWSDRKFAQIQTKGILAHPFVSSAHRQGDIWPFYWTIIFISARI